MGAEKSLRHFCELGAFERSVGRLLRYLAPEIEWTLLGVDERWREGVRVIFRKRAADLRR